MMQFGNDKIKEMYSGSDKIKEVYHGSELVWSAPKPSYAILTGGTRIDFDITNTPIANLCKSSGSSPTIINGVSYAKNAIKEIHLEKSYSGVTSIGQGFLFDCTSITNVTLNLPSLKSVDSYFMRSCTSLTNVTLNLPAFNSAGTFFLSSCTSLLNITLTTKTPPSAAGFGFLQSSDKVSSIYVPENSVASYKTTAPWSSKSSIIKAI